MEDLKGITVLLVEDDSFNQLFMKRSLENLNASVVLANNGKEAIESEVLQKVDLILMDLQMPVMNGFEAIEYIRKKLALQTPIVALTGSNSEEDKKQASTLGCNDYLVKPCNKEVLFNAISTQLKSKNNIQSNSNPTENEQKVESDPIYSLSKLEEISRGNPAFVEKMVRMLLDEMPISLAGLKEHLANKEYDRLKAVAHKMKPSVNLMDMSSINESIQKIETDAGNKTNLEDLPPLVDQVISTCEEMLEELKQQFL